MHYTVFLTKKRGAYCGLQPRACGKEVQAIENTKRSRAVQQDRITDAEQQLSNESEDGVLEFVEARYDSKFSRFPGEGCISV